MRVYLTLALPPLTLGVRPEISRAELDFMLDQNLTPSERHSIQEMRQIYDIENAMRWFQGRKMNSFGTLSPSEYEIALIEENGELLPPVVLQFMDRYREKKRRKEEASSLLFSYLSDFFSQTFDSSLLSGIKPSIHFNPTIYGLYKIEHIKRLLIGFLRAVDKEQNHEPVTSLIFKDTCQRLFNFSPDVVTEWPELYRPLYEIMREYKTSPIELESRVAQWQFDAIQNLALPNSFRGIIESFGIKDIIIYCALYNLVDIESRKGQEISQISIVEQILDREKKVQGRHV